MNGESVSEVLVESATQVYQYISDMQYATDPPMGISVSEISSYDISDGFAVLHVDGRMPDANGLMLMVGDRILQESEAGFDRYDETSRTVVVRPGEDVLRFMAESSPKVRLLTDMKFLVSVVGDFYRRYGSLLSLPSTDVVSSAPVYPEGSNPSAQQCDAVRGVLANRTSYVWGAPGTGKTQFVLATCIRAVIEAGGRVAVFAPTNNSVEQVLRGIIKAFGDDSELTGTILRLGVPTRGFYKEHPEMCEDRQAQRRLEACQRTVECLEEVMYERACDILEWEVEDMLREVRSMGDADDKVLLSECRGLCEKVGELEPFFSARPLTRDLMASFRDRDVREVVAELHDAVYRRQRPAADIEEYSSWSDEDLLSGIFEAENEMKSLRAKATSCRLEEARIIASTPHQFVSRFRPRGSDEDGRPELDVDHIFLDEAGYCGLMQAASLFTNGVPVTFLGDHMQLPPVSQLDDEALRSAAERGGRLCYGYLWSLSALYSEQLIGDGPGSLARAFVEGSEPSMMRTQRYDLTDSHRFGENLARVLDRFVYRNGMTGSASGDLSITCIDAVCDHRDGRENAAVAEAVRDFLRREMPDPVDVAILTPYSVQLTLLRRRVGRKYRDCVMTVHGSQGREWDTVVFSVADNGVVSRDVPFRFTSSESLVGMRVINTAVSRAKRRLVMVCDREFWMNRDGELIGGILRESIPE